MQNFWDIFVYDNAADFRALEQRLGMQMLMKNQSWLQPGGKGKMTWGESMVSKVDLAKPDGTVLDQLTKIVDNLTVR